MSKKTNIFWSFQKSHKENSCVLNIWLMMFVAFLLFSKFISFSSWTHRRSLVSNNGKMVNYCEKQNYNFRIAFGKRFSFSTDIYPLVNYPALNSHGLAESLWRRTGAEILNFNGKEFVVSRQFSFRRHDFRLLSYLILEFNGLAEGL